MTTQQQDVAAARAAAVELGRTVQALRRHFGESVDLTRLTVDTERVAVDLDLLAGPEPRTAERVLEVIPDVDYPADLFRDADDEGVGPHR